MVTREEFEEYVAGLRSLDASADLGSATLDVDELDDDCESGACPVR